MATITKKLLFDVMRNEDKPYWWLYDRTTTIAENQTDGTVEGSIQLLEQVLSEVENPYVDINICDKTKQEISRGGNKQKHNTYTINLGFDKKKSESSVSPSLNKDILRLMEENHKLQRDIDRLKDQQKYDALILKIDEIKNNDVLSKLLSNPQILNGISGIFGVKQPMGIASVGEGDEPITANVADRHQKIREAIIRLSKIDNKFDDTITMLADFAEKNRDQYFESIEYIKNI